MQPQANKPLHNAAMSTTPTPLRLGILGCANIARQFIRDVRPSPAVQLCAVASRSAATAQAFASENGITRALGSYQALLDDPDIDAIYLPLPNSLHAEWAVRALRAGKHVLCEKPLALNRAEAQTMFDAARAAGRMLLEAYPWWFQPQTAALVQLLNDGTVGTVRSVQASFGFTVPRPESNIRLKADLGGGALLDAGSYPMSLIRLVMGSAPQRVQAHSQWTDSGVDISTHATLLWADGRVAQLSCAMNGANHRYASIVGSAGTLETEYLNHTATQPGSDARGYLPSLLRVRRGIANTVPFEAVHSPVGSGFCFAAEAFARVVATQDFAAINRAAAASLDIAATLAAVARAARSGQTETVDAAAA